MVTIKHFKNSLTCLFVFFFFYNTNYAQVGIGTIDPKTTLDLNGALSLREGPEITLANTNNNDVLLNTSPYSSYRITGPTASFGIRRITSVSNSDGQLVTLMNFTDRQMTIRHDVGGSSNKRKIFCPDETDVVLNGKYSTVTLQYNASLEGWVLVNKNSTEKEPPIDSVSLASDYSLAPGILDDIPSMELTFEARSSTALIVLSGSGGSTSIAMGIGDFSVINVTDGTIIGGTHEKLTTFDDIYGIEPAWSISFTKAITGLTIGDSYTLKVRALLDVSVTSGSFPTLDINANTEPSHHHLTLSVLQ